jgi:hypothetical protein
MGDLRPMHPRKLRDENLANVQPLLNRVANYMAIDKSIETQVAGWELKPLAELAGHIILRRVGHRSETVLIQLGFG